MFDPSRPTSRWSTSMSATTKSTAYTNQTIPLTNVRRKLFRNSPSNQKTYAQRMAKSKHNIEELFKLYYSNDIKFDTIHRQIVTGTRIPAAHAIPVPQSSLKSDSTNDFNSKHCVSREQISPNTDLEVEKSHQTKTIKSAPIKRVLQIRTENNPTSYSPTLKHFPPITVTPVLPNAPITTPSTQQEELSDSVLVKSVAFLDEVSNETTPTEDVNTNKEKSSETSGLKSSLLTVPPAPPPPSLLTMNHSAHRKDPTALSHASSSTMASVQPQQNNPPAVVTGSAVIVRQRSSARPQWSRQRPKSGVTTTTTTTTNSSLPQTGTKPSTPSISSPLSVQPETPELPVYLGTQRVVSIPSRCSRYVLVTFPEVPLRYNAPSYVERLLLPERFPNLFQNIVQSYDHHLSSSISSHRNAK